MPPAASSAAASATPTGRLDRPTEEPTAAFSNEPTLAHSSSEIDPVVGARGSVGCEAPRRSHPRLLRIGPHLGGGSRIGIAARPPSVHPPLNPRRPRNRSRSRSMIAAPPSPPPGSTPTELIGISRGQSAQPLRDELRAGPEGVLHRRPEDRGDPPHPAAGCFRRSV